MKAKFSTITIGIPALNEANNIARLLTAISAQKTTGARKIISIIVISDGSTDKTVTEAKAVSDRRITVIEGRCRKGKNHRLNQLSEMNTSDVLVLVDADAILDGKNTIDNLVKAFKKGKSIGLVAGNVQPVAAKTIFEEASNNFIASLNFMKDKIKKGQNIYSLRGPLLALSREMLRSYQLPIDVPDDRYAYFMCKRMGFGFYYESTAKAYFRSPNTFSDQVKQGKRFREDRESLDKYFTKEELHQAYFLPFRLKVRALIFQLVRNPIAYIAMKSIQINDHATARTNNRTTWEIINSTKSLL